MRERSLDIPEAASKALVFAATDSLKTLPDLQLTRLARDIQTKGDYHNTKFFEKLFRGNRSFFYSLAKWKTIDL